MAKKCIVLFSGGLDSRLAVKIMQDKGYSVSALHFKLPFIKDDQKSLIEYANKNDFRLKIIDVSKGSLLKEYLNVIKKAEHGTGAGANPCIDCKIFMYKKAKGIADSLDINLIVTGDVEGQRPMSQQKKKMDLIEKESGLHERIFRPLIDLGFKGRQRKKQIDLAKKFNIDYPSPAGGCLLCEKYLKCRFESLLKRGLEDKEISLINVGRHFIIEGVWIILGRDEKENKILESADIGRFIVPDFIGPSALILDEYDEALFEKVKKLIKAYSKSGNSEEKRIFEEWKV